MDIELPELVALPAFMLKEGDMVYHPDHDWFYECLYDGSPPGRLGVGRLDEEVQVARSGEAARLYNRNKRNAIMDKMGDHGNPPGPND